MENEETILRAVILIISQLEESTAAQVALTRFFVSHSPSIPEDEKQAALSAVDGLEVRTHHLRDELRRLQDILRNR